MRRTMIIALAVLASAFMVCIFGAKAIGGAVARADALYEQAERAARSGDDSGAAEAVRALDAHWRGARPLLELLTGHDALSDAQAAITDARMCLESGQREEFLRVCAAAREALQYLSATESMQVVNLF